MSSTVDPLLPLVLLEAVRSVDMPDEDLEAEFVEELRTKRFGLSDTVLAQIRRYNDAVKRGQRLPVDEAVGIAKLIGRRPDAEAVFREAGRGLARLTYARVPAVTRRLVRALPTMLARPMALRHVRHIGTRFLGGSVRRVGATILLDVPGAVTRDAAPRQAGCAFYESVLRELMQLLVGGVGAVEHVRCASRGEQTCEWRAEWRSIR
jgi:predicted hydrocarbon binding protein